MQKCPYCNALIEDNARFCLYCMKELEGKAVIDCKPAFFRKKWVLLVSVTLILCVILGITVGLLLKKDHLPLPAYSKNSNSSANEDVNDSDTSSYLSESGSTAKTNRNKNTGSSTGTNPSTSVPTNNSTAARSVTENPTANNKTNDTVTNSSVETGGTKAGNKHDDILYSYRSFQNGDDFSVYASYSNAVVITSVNTVSSDGVYIVPDSIDGKKVVAVMENAFCGKDVATSVKKIVIPSTVKTIWQYAFSSCINLTDIYFSGDSVYSEGNAFPESDKRTGTLTLHTSYECSDRNFRYYRNIASIYHGVVWSEWNKVIDF